MTTRLDLIRMRLGECASITAIAAELGISHSAVSWAMKRHGLTATFRSSPAGKAAAKQLGYRLAEHEHSHRPHPDVAHRIEVVRATATAGGSYSDAAQALGVTRNAVAGIAKRAGIKFSVSP